MPTPERASPRSEKSGTIHKRPHHMAWVEIYKVTSRHGMSHKAERCMCGLSSLKHPRQPINYRPHSAQLYVSIHLPLFFVCRVRYHRNRQGESVGPRMVLTRECQMYRVDHKGDRATLTTLLSFTGACSHGVWHRWNGNEVISAHNQMLR
jgi:hypothetical protein